MEFIDSLYNQFTSLKYPIDLILLEYDNKKELNVLIFSKNKNFISKGFDTVKSKLVSKGMKFTEYKDTLINCGNLRFFFSQNIEEIGAYQASTFILNDKDSLSYDESEAFQRIYFNIHRNNRKLYFVK